MDPGFTFQSHNFKASTGSSILMVFRLNLRFVFASMAALALSGLLFGCGGGKGAAAAPPAGGIVATPGEGKVTITWNAVAGVDYWLVYAAASSISATPTPTVNHVWAQNVTSPYVIAGLANGTTYSFAMNARTGGGPGGTSTPSASAIPRTAGGSWTLDSTTAGAQMGSDPITGIAFDGSANFVGVASNGAIYKGAIASTSSILWSATTPQASYGFRAVAYRNATDGYVAVGVGGYCQGLDLASPICAATNGKSWNAVATNGIQTVMVGNGGNILHSDSVGGAWLAGAGASGNLNGLVYTGSYWIAVGDNGAIFKSADAITWSTATVSGAPSASLKGVASYGSMAIAVGASGAVTTSVDGGLTWTVQSAIDGAPGLNAVNLSYDQILVVANGGKVFTSPLLSTPVWTAVSSASTRTASNLMAVLGSSSLYFAVGSDGTSIYSQ